MDTIDIIISFLILSAIVLPIALYKRSKSLRFRLIECTSSNQVGYVSFYMPQVRIGGVWYNLYNKNILGLNVVIISHDNFDSYLDAQDALGAIEKFKSAGDFTIPSNRKLNRNEKEIIVE